MNPAVPYGLVAAFYKGTRKDLWPLGGMYSRVGRYLDRGPYSHCELKFSDGVSVSSTLMGSPKGVRAKAIEYTNTDNWDFMPIPDPEAKIEVAAWDWFEKHQGKAYDVWGNIRFASNFARDDADKWFCSEALMAMLGFSEAYRYGPSGAAGVLARFFNTRINAR